MPADGQAQAGAAHFARRGAIDLMELFEDVVDLGVGNTDARISDPHCDGSVRPFAFDKDSTTGFRKLDSIVYQVDHDLAHAHPVGFQVQPDAGRVEFHVEPLVARHHGRKFNDLVQDILQVEGLQAQVEL